ncbi:hypothetical protein BJY52DRAFT_852200 [Lactarius psammicola]|nr:hypothetical protein BJY52DRAFT_852200 [Lactarius psammicola]
MTLAYLLLIVTLVLPPTSARPVTPFTPTARQNSSTLMEHDIIFGVAFVLALLFAFLGRFVRLASGGTAGAQPAEFFPRLCTVPIAFIRQLSVFCRSAFIERAAPNVNDVNAAFVPRRGGASYPVATVPHGPHGGGPRRVGVIRGSGDCPDGTCPIYAVF